MPIDPATLAQSVSSSFQKLHDAAGSLNIVSDELGKHIARIDESLRKLNLGITVWVSVSGWDNNDEGGSNFWSEEVGYAKINGKWGVCLRRVEGSFSHPDHDSIEIWAFNDAPRVQRLDALDKIPDLLQKLSVEAEKLTTRVKSRLSDVQVVANALGPQRLPMRPVTTGGKQ
jgi:hypothetical protein